MSKKGTLRKCIGCNQMIEKANLIRIVRLPDMSVIIDGNKRANGRGAYLCKSKECLALATKMKAFNRALKVSPDEKFLENLEKVIFNED